MKRLSIILTFLALCFSSFAAPPPPILYTFYTTNKTIDVNRWVTNIATNMAVIWGGGGGITAAQSNNIVNLASNATFMASNSAAFSLLASNAVLASNVISGASITNPVSIGQIITPFPILPITVMSVARDGVVITNSQDSARTITLSTNVVLGKVNSTNTISPSDITLYSTTGTNTITSSKIRLDSSIGSYRVTLNDNGLGDISTSGQLFATNGATVTGLTNLGISYLSGNVGIGTASPDALLHVSGASGGRGILYTNPGTAKAFAVSSNATVTTSGDIVAGGTSGFCSSQGMLRTGVAGNILLYYTGKTFNIGYDSATTNIYFGATTANTSGSHVTFFGDTIWYGTNGLVQSPANIKGQWTGFNSNATLHFGTSMDGTSRSDVLKLATNALTFSDVNNSPLVTMTNAAGVGLIGVNVENPDALLHLSGQSGGRGIIYTNPGTAKSFTVSSNATVACSGPFTASGTITASGSGVSAGGSITAGNNLQCGADFSVILGSGRSRIYSITNGTVRVLDSAATAGSTLILDSVAALPFPSASKYVLQTNQWGLANTNGRLVAIIQAVDTTSTNSTDVARVMEMGRFDWNFQNTNNSPLVMMTNAGGVGLIRVASQMESAQPIGCFGGLGMNTTNTGAFGAVYTNVTGFNYASTNQFGAGLASGTLTNVIAGYYDLSGSISFAPITGDKTWEVCILTNGVDSELISGKKNFDNPARMDDVTVIGPPIYLPAGTQISLALKAPAGVAETISIHRASLKVRTP